MPLKINSRVDEVNGVLVRVLTAAAAQELVLGAGPAGSSEGPPSEAQAPGELNRLVCWPSEPAGTQTHTQSCRNEILSGHTQTHTEIHVNVDARQTDEQMQSSQLLTVQFCLSSRRD